MTTYYNTKDGVILSQTDGTDTWYFQYDANGTPLGFIRNGVQYFYFTNQMGDVLSIADAGGDELVEYEYDEWGKLILTRAGNQSNESIANINPIRYRGYYYDTETGYYYLQSRYYDPSICRFINSDIPEIAGMSKGISAGTNLFGYCNNNPVNDSDPTGNISFSQLKTAFNNAMDLFKNAIKKILKKVGIWKSGSYLYIKTSLLAGAIDTIILAGSAVKAVAVKSVFKLEILLQTYLT